MFFRYWLVKTTSQYLPVPVLRPIAEDLLFRPKIPVVGDTCTIEAPRVLVRAATDTARRLADSMHEKKSEITVNRLLARIEREMEKLVYY